MPEKLTVEALRQTSSERVAVVLSSGEEIKSTLSTAAELRLYRGQELDENKLAELRRRSGLSLLKARAMELVSRRPMSEKELTDKLLQHGADPKSAAQCVHWLRELRLLDDESYAAAVARHYAAKGYGEARIRQELSRRGVPRDYWDDALTNRPDNTEKLDKLIAARLHNPEDRDEVRKVSAALARRGFGWDEIREALARFRAETDFEEEP